MTSLSSFSRFSSLPTELRIKIWVLNLPGPRIVPIYYLSANSDRTVLRTRKTLRGCTSPAPIPSNLHANREARNEALQHYTLSFNLAHCRAKIFFNPSIDVLYFGEREGYMESYKQFVNTAAMVQKGQLGKVRRLAVSEDLFLGLKNTSNTSGVSPTCMKEFWECVRAKYDGVKEVAIVLKEGEKDEKSADASGEAMWSSSFEEVKSDQEQSLKELRARITQASADGRHDGKWGISDIVMYEGGLAGSLARARWPDSERLDVKLPEPRLVFWKEGDMSSVVPLGLASSSS